MDYQDELDELIQNAMQMPPERFYRLWATIALKEGWPFSIDGQLEYDAAWAWEEWVETLGEMRPQAVL